MNVNIKTFKINCVKFDCVYTKIKISLNENIYFKTTNNYEGIF